MRPHKTDPKEKGFVLLGKLTDQLRRLHRGLAIGMHKIIALGFHHHKRVSAHHRPFTVWIALQGLAFTRRAPFRAGAVVAFVPGSGVIRAVPTLLDTAGHAHVIYLAHARSVIAVIHEMLAPRGAIADLRSRTLVAQHPRGMRIIPAHE